MDKITKEEAILYIALVSTGIIYIIFYGVRGPVDIYNQLFNINIVTLLYTPIFLYNLLKIMQHISQLEVITRYESISKLIKSRIEVLFDICLRISIYFVAISDVFLILNDVGIIFQKEFWIISILSIYTQFIGWMFIGILYLVIIEILRDERLAYIIQLVLFASVTYILSPLMFGNLKNIIPPIWDIMFFYDLNLKTTDKLIYGVIILLINLVLAYIYKFLLKNRDIRSKG